MIATAKKRGNFMPASGVGFNPGRIAGGRVTPPPPGGTGVFGQRPYTAPKPPNPQGGLIDKRQQKDPSSTAGLPHPFDGPNYRPVSTQPQKVATVATNSIPGKKVFSASIGKVAITDRGTFFAKKLTPIIKTQFGANKSGPKSNTPFHPNPPKRVPQQQGTPQVETTKIVNQQRPHSFGSHGNLWQDPNNSYIKGHSNPASGGVGSGRWATTKRSAV